MAEQAPVRRRRPLSEIHPPRQVLVDLLRSGPAGLAPTLFAGLTALLLTRAGLPAPVCVVLGALTGWFIASRLAPFGPSRHARCGWSGAPPSGARRHWGRR